MADPKCEGHDDLVAAAARGSAMFEEHGRQLSGIFDKLDSIKTMVENNRVRAEMRDKSLMEVSEGILEVDHKIENGLRSEVKDIQKKINQLVECIDKRREERAAAVRDARTRGFRGFLRPGWVKFKQEASFITVAGVILFGIWFVIWIAGKTTIFHEGPMELLKLFGIG